MNTILVIFFIGILLFGIIVLIFVVSRGKQTSVLNVEKFRTSWLAIEQKLRRDNESSYTLAVFDADKLLDTALKQRGFKGETMGERMKSAQQHWSNANVVWSSHKLRNQLAHESGAQVSYDEARRALAGFKQGLKDLGAV